MRVHSRSSTGYSKTSWASTCTFDHRLQLVYGDKKTISLIPSVKKQRKYSMNTYGRFDWLLPIPGLFHWKTNYMDMIYDINSGSDPSHALIHTTLLHNERYMGCDRCRRARVPRRQGLCTYLRQKTLQVNNNNTTISLYPYFAVHRPF